MRDYEFHEIANLFPLMFEKEFKEFKEDIKKNGLQEPIILYEDKILDGRNRYKACRELGIEPDSKIFSGEDPTGYIISKNVFRRHLNLWQKTKIAMLLLPKYAKRAREHQIEAGRRYGKRHPRGKVSLNSQKAIKPIYAVKEVCKVVGISPSSYYESRYVQKKIEELSKTIPEPTGKLEAEERIDKLEKGRVSLNSAYLSLQGKEILAEKAKTDAEEAKVEVVKQEAEREEVLKDRRKVRKAKAEKLESEKPLILWQNLKNAVNEYSEWFYIHEDFLKDEAVFAMKEGIREACKVLEGIRSSVQRKAIKLLQGAKDITPKETVSRETTEDLEKGKSKIIDIKEEKGEKNS